MLNLFLKREGVDEICINDGECNVVILRDDEGYKVEVYGKDYLSDKSYEINHYGEPIVQPVGEVFASFEDLRGGKENDD